MTLSAGVYVLTGGLDVEGQGDFTGTGVTIYLTCPGSKSTGAYQACPASESSFTGGGWIYLAGKGSDSLTAPSCLSGTFPQCPGASYGYDGVAVLADPHLLDGSSGTSGAAGADVATCESSGSDCALDLQGKGGSVTINGSVDMRSSGLGCPDQNCNDTISDGFVIANSVYWAPTGSTSLALSGPGTAASNGTCSVLVMGVYSGSTPPSSPASAVIQSQCGSNSESGVVNFNYGP